ncbi:MAG: hypothetical protein WBP28_13580 [Nostocoides sp.]
MAAYLLMTHGDQVAWEAMSAEEEDRVTAGAPAPRWILGGNPVVEVADRDEAVRLAALLPEAPGGAASGVEIRGCWGGA